MATGVYGEDYWWCFSVGKGGLARQSKYSTYLGGRSLSLQVSWMQILGLAAW